jgi:hypothetical protein
MRLRSPSPTFGDNPILDQLLSDAPARMNHIPPTGSGSGESSQQELLYKQQEQLRRQLSESTSEEFVMADTLNAWKGVAVSVGKSAAAAAQDLFIRQPDCIAHQPSTSDPRANPIISYTHECWVNEFCPLEVQQFLEVVLIEAHSLLYAKVPTPAELYESKAFIFAALIGRLDRSQFQWPPAIGVRITANSICHSTILQSMLGKSLQGTLGSAVTLASMLKSLASHAEIQSLPTQCDIIFGDDNQSPAYMKISNHAFQIKLGIIVTIRLALCCPTTTQLNPLNSPKLWRKWKDCDPEIQEITVADKALMEIYYFDRIFSVLMKLEFENYCIGDSNPTQSPLAFPSPPVVDATEACVGEKDLRRECPECHYFHNLIFLV